MYGINTLLKDTKALLRSHSAELNLFSKQLSKKLDMQFERTEYAALLLQWAIEMMSSRKYRSMFHDWVESGNMPVDDDE